MYLYDRYIETYGVPPTFIAASAFASGSILSRAVELSNSLNTNDVSAALMGNYFPTFYANLTFDSNHQASFDMLVFQIQYNQTKELVFPSSVADTSYVYPVPTWKEVECQTSTDFCSGHGTCNTNGTCECNANYYNSGNVYFCDAFCAGEVTEDANACLQTRQFYIGGLADFQDLQAQEYMAHMRYAVELINNKSDGWFDDTPQVYLHLMINNTACDGDGAVEALSYQEEWATSHEGCTALDGLIGPMCSSARFV
jgi:hypothetical protein